MEDNDDSLEKVIEEEETSRVTISRSTAPTEYDNEDDSNDAETSVLDESLPELEPPSTYSTEPSNVSRDRHQSGADGLRRWSASDQQHDSPRRSRILLPEDVRPVRSRSDSEIKEYGPVRKWAVDYNNRNYIRSFCHKPTGNHRKPMGRTFDWDVDYDNLCYIRSLFHVPKGRHRRIKEVPRKTVPDNDILADSTGWQFEYGHAFPQVEEDVPYTPEERVVARGAYRCYGVNRSQSDTLLNVDIEREPVDDFREDEFKYGREFLQDDMPLMILGKEDRRTLRGGYRFYDVDRSKCDQYTSQNDNDGYDYESENIPDISKGRKFKRTILKKTLQYPKKLTDSQFGVALSFVPGEGSEEDLEGISTTLPSLRPKKRGVRNAFKKTKVAEPRRERDSLQRDMWERPNETRHSRPPPLREEALRRASEKAEVINNLRRSSIRRDSEEDYYPDRNRRDSYRAKEERRLSRTRNGVTRAELAFQPRVSFEYEKVRQRTKSFDRTPQSRRSFKDEKRGSIKGDGLERRISTQRRRPSFRDEDSYQKRVRVEDDELERRIPDQRRRSSLRDKDSFQKREMMEEDRERRMSNQRRRSSLRDEEPYKARMDNERVRRISDQIRKPIRRSEDSYQTNERDDKEMAFKSTPILGRRKTDDTIGRGISPIKQHPRMSHGAHQARMYDDTVRRIPDQVRRQSRRSKDLRVYQGEESDEEEDEETFISTAVLGRRPTVDATERRRSTLKEQPRMVYHQGDESDEGEETFTSTAVFGRRQTDDGRERRRSAALKDHPRMVYHQGDESDEDNEETFTSTATFGRRQTDDAMERRRSSHKEQPRISYGHHQPHKEQPRMSYDRHQPHKEHARMVHHQDEEDEDEQIYTATASWGNPHKSRQASRNSGQGYSSMASRKGDRSSKLVGSKEHIVSEREESCLRTRSKRRLETIVSEEKSLRKTDRVVRKKSDRSIDTRNNRYDAKDGSGRVAHQNRNGSRYEDRAYEAERPGGQMKDNWKTLRATVNKKVAHQNRNGSRYEDRAYEADERTGGQMKDNWKTLRETVNKKNDLEKRSCRSPCVRNQPKSSYKENTQSNYSGREMNNKQLVRQRKEIQSCNEKDLLNEFRKHRHHPNDYGEYAEDGYEKFLDENGCEVYEKVKKKRSKLFHRIS